jgi:hypothetical protein
MGWNCGRASVLFPKGQAMPKHRRSIPSLVMTYAGVFGIVAFTTAYALSNAALLLGDSDASMRDKTVLDQRIASAREIREALSRPLPPVAPLPPITAKVAKPNSVAAREPREREVSPNSFAGLSILSTVTLRPGLGEPERASSYAAEDRSGSTSRRVSTKRDRLGMAGW